VGSLRWRRGPLWKTKWGRWAGRRLRRPRQMNGRSHRLSRARRHPGSGRAASHCDTALKGDGSSGKTTLGLRAVAQVQAAGGIAAYLDLARSLDPVEAAARGVALEWLVVLTPDTLEEALSMAAMLLQDRTVDLLLLEPAGPDGDRAGLPAAVLGERLHRLAALARRAEVQLLVLEPPNLPAPITGALAQIAALRLELSRRAWIRLGRDVVGQRTEVRVSRDRYGPPGRATEVRIMYAEGGPRNACLARERAAERDDATKRASGCRSRRPGSRTLGPRALGPRRPAARGRSPPRQPGRRRPFLSSLSRVPPMRLLHLYWPHLLIRLARTRSSVPFAVEPIVLGRHAVDERAGAGREQVGAGAGGSARACRSAQLTDWQPEARFLDPKSGG